ELAREQLAKPSLVGCPDFLFSGPGSGPAASRADSSAARLAARAQPATGGRRRLLRTARIAGSGRSGRSRVPLPPGGECPSRIPGLPTARGGSHIPRYSRLFQRVRGRRRKKAVAPLHFYTPAGYNHVILSGSHPLPAGTIPSRALFWEVLHVIKVGIVGASGYTGGELMRILFGHPSASIVYVGSRSLAGQRVRDVLPAVPPWCDLE